MCKQQIQTILKLTTSNKLGPLCFMCCCLLLPLFQYILFCKVKLVTRFEKESEESDVSITSSEACMLVVTVSSIEQDAISFVSYPVLYVLHSFSRSTDRRGSTQSFSPTRLTLPTTGGPVLSVSSPGFFSSLPPVLLARYQERCFEYILRVCQWHGLNSASLGGSQMVVRRMVHRTA
jgi:hypothetical protein